MYAKLILRNAKRSVRDYLIYIVTMTICVMLFYGFLSISSSYYHPELGVEYDTDGLTGGMKLAICGVTCLLFFLIQYVNRYMLLRRQKEFAMEAVLGMEQRIIGWMFFAETMVMGALSIGLGIVLGMVASQFISAMLLTAYGEPYRFTWMLFPDTVALTVGFFVVSMLAVGLSGVRTIRKIKIIDMLYADRQNEPEIRKSRYMHAVVAAYGLALLLMTASGISKVYYYYDVRLPFLAQVMYFGNILAPVTAFLFVIGWYCGQKFSRNASKTCWNFEQFLMLETVLTLVNMGFAALVPIVSDLYYLAGLESGTMNSYLMFLLFDVIFFISCVIYLAGNLLEVFKERSQDYKYHGSNLFFFGQIISRLSSTSQTMTLICLALVLSAVLFVAVPALTGWATGYLNVRALYDIQISTTYNNSNNEEYLAKDQYEMVSEFLAENQIPVEYDCTFNLYLPEYEDFHRRYKLDFPVVAIALSDYNTIREMLSHEPVYLEADEFTTQWQTIATEKERETFLDAHATVTTDAGIFRLADNDCYTEPIGEMVYNSYTDVLYVFPDAACEQFLPVMRDRFVSTEEPISYALARKMESAFLKQYSEEPDEMTGICYYLRMRTLQVNSSKASNFIMQTSMTYAAIVLMVICLTILSLQQLSEGWKYRYRFQVLYKLGVDRADRERLILRQLAVWFGLPIAVAVFVAAVLTVGFFKTIAAQIMAYVGWGNLMVQVGTMVCILAALLGCYFVSTWVMFKRAVEIQGDFDCLK